MKNLQICSNKEVILKKSLSNSMFQKSSKLLQSRKESPLEKSKEVTSTSNTNRFPLQSSRYPRGPKFSIKKKRGTILQPKGCPEDLGLVSDLHLKLVIIPHVNLVKWIRKT
jgi:hypothetical protein